MNVYEIDREMYALVNLETGEILDFEAFEALHMERDRKVENICLWIKNLTAEASAIDAEIKTLTERKKAAEKKAERLKAYAKFILGGADFSTAKVSVSYRKSEAVEVNEELLPKKYFAKTITYKPDKKSLKELLKGGQRIKGAELVTRNNIQIK